MHPEHKVRSLAHQLGPILSMYDECLSQWRREPGDLGRYERAQANLDLVRVLTDKVFPNGRVEIGELLRAHQDLKLLVLRRHMARSASPRELDDMERVLGAQQLRHAVALASVSQMCRQRAEAGMAAESDGRARSELRRPITDA